MVNLAGYFTDPDGDALTYGATSSDVTIASVIVSGSVLTITGVAAGAAAVTVTATDGGGLSALQGFAVTVPNRAPKAVGEIGDLEIAVDSVAELDVAVYFTDPDGGGLEFGAASSDTTRVRVAVSGSILTITGVTAGAAAVTVTATDGGGLSARQSFAVTVPNRAPEVTDTIPPQILTVGDTRSWAGSEYFADPDGDPLMLTAGT
ncbi:MAG: RTX toxin, partial [Gemmatimonadetes bacterium]|nr:RTX toxin [Gemmatimonadota bacterium]